MADANNITDSEITRRVLYAAFFPVVRLAASLQIPLSDMKKLLETAYFHEVKRRGSGPTDAMDIMAVSKSKSAQLSRQLKTNFMDVEESLGLERRIEYMLWAEPLSGAKIKQLLPNVDNSLVDGALDVLVKQSRVAYENDKFKLVTKQSRRVWSSWLKRQDGLQKAMLAVGDTVFARFFSESDRSFARSLSLHIREEDLSELNEFYEQTLFPFLSKLNETADDAGDGIEMGISLFWSETAAALKEYKK